MWANLFIVILLLLIIAFWIYNLANWDGQCHCDKETQCETCPYHGICDDELKP
jgi:hypothetical protein